MSSVSKKVEAYLNQTQPPVPSITAKEATRLASRTTLPMRTQDNYFKRTMALIITAASKGERSIVVDDPYQEFHWVYDPITKLGYRMSENIDERQWTIQWD